ncbi:MAG: GlsB/YeaQ/YmgE family stress response membrane protein [Saprospiraceae bacterium]|nr:GlsB/YeaQ/YmgE family stress response membrane protein [Saprospiraceae bacterium]
MEWSLGNFDWHLVATIFFGALSGYVASRILGGDGYGFFGNIVVGVIGGFIGSYLVKLAKVPMMDGFFGNLISSVGGAIVLIFILEIIKYIQKSNRESQHSRRRR